MAFARRCICLAVPLLFILFCAVPVASQTPKATAPMLTLDEAVKIAVAQNPLLKTAAQNVTVANDETASARTALLPVLQVRAGAEALLSPLNVRVPTGSLGNVNQAPFPASDATVYSAPDTLGLLGATIKQPLTQLPSLRLNLRLQQIEAQVAQAHQRERRLTLVANVKQTYYEILETQDGILAAQERLTYDQELTRTVADFVAHETALEADLLDAQAQAAKQELALTALRDTLADAQERLNALLGRDISTPFEVALPAVNSLPLDDADAPMLEARAMQQRPELQEAQLRMKQAEIGRRLAQQPNLPAVSLALSYQQLAGRVAGLPNSLAMVGLQFDWTPIDWGRRQSVRDKQAQQSAQAQEVFQDTQTQIESDIHSKIRRYRQAAAQLSVAQLGQRAAQERLREMTNQYKARAILLKDLLQQQTAAADADSQEQQAMIGVLAARTALEIAAGDEE